jgi:hypothetical protein
MGLKQEFISFIQHMPDIMNAIKSNPQDPLSPKSGIKTAHVPAKTVKHHPTPTRSIKGCRIASPMPASAQRIRLLEAAAVEGAVTFMSVRRVERIYVVGRGCVNEAWWCGAGGGWKEWEGRGRREVSGWNRG